MLSRSSTPADPWRSRVLVDEVFRDGAGSATVAAASFGHLAPGALASDYVLVLPDVDAARTMADTLADPALHRDCLIPFAERFTDENPTPDPPFSVNAFRGSPAEPPALSSFDDQFDLRAYTRSDGYRCDRQALAGIGVPGPEPITVAALAIRTR